MADYLNKTGLAYLWSKLKGAFAPLASPALTGTPTAPTAATTDNSTKLATTEYVKNNVSAIDVSALRDNSDDNIFGTQSGSSGVQHGIDGLLYFKNNKVTNMNTVYKTGFYGTDKSDTSMPYTGYWFCVVFCKDESNQIAVQWAMDVNKAYNGQLWIRTIRLNASGTASGNMIGTWVKFASDAEATASLKGLMSAADKTKLDGIDTSKFGDMLKSVYDTDGDGVVDKAKAADSATNANNATTVGGFTVGVSVPANAKFTDTIVDISGKVDKVTGKGLSTSDYTVAEKAKVANIPANTNQELAGKASTGSTLSDYGINDAYTKTEVDTKTAGFKNTSWQTISIPVASWDTTALTVTVAVSGMTADTTASSAIVSYEPSTKDIFNTAEIYCSAQGANTLTFTCSAVPTAAVSVNIMVIS